MQVCGIQWKSEIQPPLSPKALNQWSLNLACVLTSGTLPIPLHLPICKILLRSDKGVRTTAVKLEYKRKFLVLQLFHCRAFTQLLQ